MASDLSLHKAVFEGHFSRVEEILKNKNIKVDKQDIHGNTPLMIAVMKGNKDFVEMLIKNGAKTEIRNSLNWSPTHEAVSYGDIQICKIVHRGLFREFYDTIKKEALIKVVKELKEDFIMTFEVRIKDYFPSEPRYLPEIEFKLYKKGSKLRITAKVTDSYHTRHDTYHVILDLSENSESLMTIMLDSLPIYQIISNEEWEQIIAGLLGDVITDEDMIRLMQKEISSAKLVIKKSEPNQQIFRRIRSRKEGNFDITFYESKYIEMETKKRSEHLTARQENQTNGQSLTPPADRSDISWDQYIDSPKGKFPHLGRSVIETVEYKTVSLVFGLTNDIRFDWRSLMKEPLGLCGADWFFPFIQQLFKELPKGFPVSIDFPIKPSTYLKYKCRSFEVKNDISDLVFTVPEYYERTTIFEIQVRVLTPNIP